VVQLLLGDLTDPRVGAQIAEALAKLEPQLRQALGPAGRALASAVYDAIGQALANPTPENLRLALVGLEEIGRQLGQRAKLTWESFQREFNQWLGGEQLKNLIGSQAAQAWQEIAAAMDQGAEIALQSVVRFATSIQQELGKLPEFLRGSLGAQFQQALKDFIEGPTAETASVLVSAAQRIHQAVELIPRDFEKLPGPIRAAISAVVDAVGRGVVGVEDAQKAISQVLDALEGSFDELPDSVRAAIAEVVAALQAGAVDAAEALNKILALLNQANAAARAIRSGGGGGGGGGGFGGGGGRSAVGSGRPPVAPEGYDSMEEVAPGVWKVTYRDPMMPPGSPPITGYVWDPGLLEKIYGPGPITEDKIRDYIKYYGGKRYAAGGLLTEPVVGVGLRTRTLYQLGENGPEWVVPDRSLLSLVSGVMAGTSFALAPLAEKLRAALAPVQQAASQAAQTAQAVQAAQAKVKQALPVVDSLDQVMALVAQVRGDSPFVTVSVLTGPPGPNQSWYNLIAIGGQLYAAGTIREQADAVAEILKASGLAEGNRSFPGLSVIARNAGWVQSLPPYPGTSGATQTVAEQGRVVHGLARGGLLTEPVVGIGLRTGTAYQLAERGPEWVVPASARMAGQGGGPTSGPIIIQRFEGEARPDVVRRAVRDALWLSGMPGVTTP
jgi:hypothetical protein